MKQRLTIFSAAYQASNVEFSTLSNLLWNLFEKIIKLMKWLMILISLFRNDSWRILHFFCKSGRSAILLANIWKIYATGKKGWERGFRFVSVARRLRVQTSNNKKNRKTKFFSLCTAVPYQQLNTTLVDLLLNRSFEVSRAREKHFTVFQSAKDEEEILKKLWRNHESPACLILKLYFNVKKFIAQIVETSISFVVEKLARINQALQRCTSNLQHQVFHLARNCIGSISSYPGRSYNKFPMASLAMTILAMFLMISCVQCLQFLVRMSSWNGWLEEMSQSEIFFH